MQEIQDQIKSIGNEHLYIVYLDDESDLIEILSDLFNLAGFKTFGTTSFESAIEFIEKHPNDIAFIISDYKMDPKNGFDFREKVLPIAPEIPFYILSAHITKELALKGVELKISGFLDKPITPEKISDFLSKDGISRIKTMIEDRELLFGFVEESLSNLEQAEDLALAFEKNQNDLEAVNKCFGLVHTLKGASSYFKPKTLSQFVHRFEDLLKKIQRAEILLSPEVVSSILRSFDFIKLLLLELKSGEHQKIDLALIFKEYFETRPTPSSAPDNPAQPLEKSPQLRTSDKEIFNEIKVPVHSLDSFMQTSGEMTVIRNMINKCVRSIEVQFPENKDVSMLSELLDELHGINATIQFQITNLRKVPLRSIIKPIPRVVRDLSKQLNKEVELVTVGEDLTVDTAIATVLNNSIIHLVRNSLDHGIGTPEEREKKKKSKRAKITISALQKNDSIVVTVEDDGRGIHEDSIRKKLIKNGSHTELEAQKLEKNELYLMIFESGFSTAEKVTDISGRGIGLSVVKDAVTSVGGNIAIESATNVGTKFILSMPVPKSVLIRDCLFVSSGGMHFGIPQDDILRVLKIPAKNSNTIFEIDKRLTINDKNNNLVAIVDLAELLAIKPAQNNPNTETDDLNLIMIQSGNRKIALQVDQILDIEDTVIKKLQGPTKKIETFQGVAYMGDGSIGLILSAEGLLNQAKITATSSRPNQSLEKDSEANPQTKNELLLFRINEPSLYGIPSQLVYRIEEINEADLRTSNKTCVIPYRNKIMTVLKLSELFNQTNKIEPISQSPSTARHPTIVFERNEQFLGIIVDSIDSIADVYGEPTPVTSLQTHLSAGNYIFEDQIISLIDLAQLFNLAKEF